MHESNGTFFTLTLLFLLLALAIFAMKFAVQWLSARAEASKATATDARIATVEGKADGLERRVAHLEALIKEVE